MASSRKSGRGVPWRLATADERIHTTLAVALIAGFLYQTLSGSFEDTRHMWVLFGMLAGFRSRSRS